MSNQPKILVTAAAGKTGSAVAKQLLELGFPVRAFVRSNDHRARALEEAGAEIFVGDLAERDDLMGAMEGVKRAYFVAPWSANQLYKAISFAVAAADSKLESVVAVTQWLAQPQHPSAATRESWLTDRVFDWMPGVDVTLVNPGWFADNYMEVLEPIAQLGIFPFALGEGRVAPVSNEDIARVVVGVLKDPAPHAGKTYHPTGPKALGPQEIAEAFGRVLGRKVKYQDMSERMFNKAITALKIPTRLHAQLRHYVEEYRRGGFEAGSPTNVVKEIGGSEPEDFETIARRYVAANPRARRTLWNKIRAIGGLIKIAFTRARDLDAYEEALSTPHLREPKHSSDYEPWRATHDVPNAYGVNAQSASADTAQPALSTN